MTAVSLGPKLFKNSNSRPAFKNRKRKGGVDRQQVRSIDRIFFSSN